MSDFTNFELPKQKKITELEAVSVNEKVFHETRKDTNGEDYDVNFIVREGIEYRVPNSVITQVQELIKSDNLKTFKVLKTGEGLKTKYSIKVLE